MRPLLILFAVLALEISCATNQASQQTGQSERSKYKITYIWSPFDLLRGATPSGKPGEVILFFQTWRHIWDDDPFVWKGLVRGDGLDLVLEISGSYERRENYYENDFFLRRLTFVGLPEATLAALPEPGSPEESTTLINLWTDKARYSVVLPDWRNSTTSFEAADPNKRTGDLGYAKWRAWTRASQTLRVVDQSGQTVGTWVPAGRDEGTATVDDSFEDHTAVLLAISIARLVQKCLDHVREDVEGS